MSRRTDILDPEVARGLAELEAALAAEPGTDPALVLLAEDLRADTPRMSPVFAERLDERVEAGFHRERTRTPGWLPVRRTWLLPTLGVAASALVALVVVIALNGGTGDEPTAMMADGPALESAEPDASTGGGSNALSPGLAAPSTADDQAAPVSPAARARRGAATNRPGFGRKVERSAQLTLTTAPDDVQEVADGVVRVTQEVDGIVERSSTTTSDGQGSARFALRIPTRRLDDALERLSRLAHVGALSQSADDITAPFISTADRLSDARAERRALLRALAKATTPAQIASLRARIRANRSEIAAYKGELDSLRRRANFANIDVAVEGTGSKKEEGGSWSPGDAFRDAMRVLEVAAGVALVALAVLVPLALLAGLTALGARLARRRRREQALDAA